MTWTLSKRGCAVFRFYYTTILRETWREYFQHDFLYCSQVKCKSWLELDLKLAPLGLQSTALDLPIELSSQQGLEESFIHIKCTKYFHDDLNAIQARMCMQCFDSIYYTEQLSCRESWRFFRIYFRNALNVIHSLIFMQAKQAWVDKLKCKQTEFL